MRAINSACGIRTPGVGCQFLCRSNVQYLKAFTVSTLHKGRSFFFYIQCSNCSSNFFSCHLLLKSQHPISCHLSFASNTKTNFFPPFLCLKPDIQSLERPFASNPTSKILLAFAGNPTSNFMPPFFWFKHKIQFLSSFLLLETQYPIFFCLSFP